MIIILFIIGCIWLYFKYEPKIDILEKDDKEYLVLWYNNYKQPSKREYFILF